MFENEYKTLRIASLYNQDRVKNIYTNDSYNEYLASNDYSNGGVGEVVGDPTKQVKPYFDFDSTEIKFDESYKNALIQWMKDTYNMDISIMSRADRLKDGKNKSSFRAYVQNYRISYSLITIYFEALFIKYNGIVDVGVYNNGRVLLTLGNKRKSNIDVPPLIMDNQNENMENCFATYIEETYVNLDDRVDVKIRDEIYSKVMKKIEIKKDQKEEVEEDDSEDENPSIDNIKDIIDHLKPNRADTYEDWLNGCFAIIGACKKSNINKKSCLELIHQFSAICPNKYEEDKVNEWFYTNYRRQMEHNGNQYAYGYLLKCLKEDNLTYYNQKHNPKFKNTYDKVANFVKNHIYKINKQMTWIETEIKRDEYNYNSFDIYTKSELIHRFQQLPEYTYYDKKIDKKTGDVKYEEKYMFAISSPYWTDTRFTTYDKFVFVPNPDTIVPDNYYNQFQGFECDNLPKCNDYSLIEPINSHIDNIMCNGNKQAGDYFRQWLAYNLMGLKTRIMMMLRGVAGAGKTIILEWFIEKILGRRYSFKTSNPEKEVFGQFNGHLSNVLTLLIEEGGYELRHFMDRFKDLITSDTMTIEKKFQQAITCSNLLNPIILTNNNNILSLSIDDRRLEIYQCSDEKMQNSEYFEDLGRHLKDNRVIAAFANYLRNEVYIPNYDFQANRTKSNFYKKLIQANIPNPFIFLQQYNYDIEWSKYKGETYHIVKVTELYSAYVNWATPLKYEIYKYQAFDTKLTECDRYGITKVEYNRFRNYKFNKEQYLKAMNNFQIEHIPKFSDDDLEFYDN